MGTTEDPPEYDDTDDEATVFLHLTEGSRVLVGMRDDVVQLAHEVADLLGTLDGAARWRELCAFLYDGRDSDEPVSREMALAIGNEAADLLPLTYGQMNERSKMVLERLVGLRSL
jgi:hypothetical protein